MYYICENDKPNIILKKFNIVKVQGNKIMLPLNLKDIGNENNIKKENKFAEKINKIIQLSDTNKVVLSKEIQKCKILLNKLHTYNLDIVDGNWLFYMLLPEVIEYIVDKQNWDKEQTTVYILVNDISENLIQMLKLFTRYL